MRRREAIALLGSAAAWPLVARAQHPGHMRRIGVLMATVQSDPDAQARLAALRQALRELGWTDGRNAVIEYRWAGADLDLMRAFAAELVGMTPDVILAHSPPGIMAAQRQTRTVPLVFVMVPAPVEIGLVASLTRPGGNITGLTHFETAMAGKWLETLREISPSLSRVAFLLHQEHPAWSGYARTIAEAASAGVEDIFRRTQGLPLAITSISNGHWRRSLANPKAACWCCRTTSRKSIAS